MALSVEEGRSKHTDSAGGRDLAVSLCLLCVLVAVVLSGLAWDENWRKLLRVLLGFGAYLIVLLAALRVYSLRRRKNGPFPFPAFAMAGAMAEASSGWLRPTAATKIDILTVLAAAILIGGVHWLALRYWRPLRERIMHIERRKRTA